MIAPGAVALADPLPKNIKANKRPRPGPGFASSKNRKYSKANDKTLVASLSQLSIFGPMCKTATLLTGQAGNVT